jgi:uncharacterized phage protein gp47/JayE
MPGSKLAAAGISLVLVAGCGGGSDGEVTGGSVAARDWAQEVCGAVKVWSEAVQEGSGSLGADLQGAAPEEITEILAGFMGESVAATGALIETVQGAGTPDVAGGEAFAQELDDTFTRARGALAEIKTQIEAIEADTPEEVQKATAALGPDIQAALSTVDSNSIEDPSPELTKVMRQVEECDGALGV